MPRYRDGFPRPKKEWHNGTWRIAWRWNRTKYAVTTTVTERQSSEIEILVRNLASQLASNDRPDVSPPWDTMPGMVRYISDRYGSGLEEVPPGAHAWLHEYEREINGECSPRWAALSVGVIQKMSIAVGGLANIGPETASRYLADVTSCRKPGTRNRLLAIFKRFYGWAVRTHRVKTNPFAGIKIIKEERLSDIVYCTPAERDEAIALAKATGWPEWMAVAIACYAGMRREEISRLIWPDVRFDAGLIVVPKTKTGKSRTIPLNTTLEQYLRAVPDGKRSGYVVACPPDVDRLWRMDNLMRNVQRAKKAAMLDAWNIVKPPPSRAKEYREQKAAYEAEKQKRAAQIEAALERLGWNAWRHTFGSLLAQAGVSIDKISAWMGNTPEVCRRHYAQFVPRDKRDSEIDRI